MKRAELFFTAILVPLDYLMLVFAGVSAYAIRYSQWYQEQIREVVFSLEFSEYIRLVAQMSLLWVFIFALVGLYAIRPRGRAEEMMKIFLSCSAGVMAIVVIIFFQREFFASRFIVLAAWVLAVAYVSGARIIVREIQIRLLKKGIGARRALIVGDDDTSKELARIYAQRPALGVQVVDRVPSVDEQHRSRIEERARSRSLDMIIQGDAHLPRDQSLTLLDIAHVHHVDFQYAADLFTAHASNVSVNTLAGVPLVDIKRTRLDGWGRIVKRGFDLALAGVGILVCLPVFAVIAAVIAVDSPGGPIIVRLQRVGARGSVFTLYKFRSMVPGADKMKQDLLPYNERADGPLFKMRDDPRITRSGKVLRRWSLDELPQLVNVIKGEMSLVGPRPHEPQEVARYQKHHRHLLDIKPGITGMAQVSGRSDLPFEDEVKLDVYYIENWSLYLDIMILLRTPLVVLSRRAAV